jgi:hypothetical protein
MFIWQVCLVFKAHKESLAQLDLPEQLDLQVAQPEQLDLPEQLVLLVQPRLAVPTHNYNSIMAEHLVAT